MGGRATIAVLSLACRFADARSPAELWASVLEGRRAFRAVPPERLDLARYAADVLGEADSITPIRAGLLSDWAFDRARFRISKGTYEATDLAHWLALELAAEAVQASGGLDRLDRARTAVVVANTLTGEFSRAALLRLRAPFLDDLLADAAEAEGLAPDVGERLRRGFAAALRERFPAPSEDSLAGGLANTIAGRIANYFDLKGGAYTVDGACASSLVAIADAGNLLATGQADSVIVGAVDLSLDPFELVGFSRNGALARDEMRVFDARANGFWPGEGGAFAVMTRHEDAKRAELPAVALIRGWGLSTDGAGGLTRPSVAGQLAACQRACEQSGIDPADLAFVEAHGTGTAVGDPIEIQALAALRDGASEALPVGSIKANIGHTKAAAGFAGLIKAAGALRHGILPAHVGCTVPHPVFAEVDHRVRPALVPERLGSRHELAGVSNFGFGGINAHVVLESVSRRRSAAPLPCAPKAQEAELFVFAGASAEEVRAQLAAIEAHVPSMLLAEITDAAADCARNLRSGPLRAAVVASDAGKLAEQLARAKSAISKGETLADKEAGVFVGHATNAPRLGFVFPGQAAPVRLSGGAWARRFEGLDLPERLPKAAATLTATETAQPAIARACLAGLSLLSRAGVAAEVAVGHSVGEILALTWAGVYSPKQAMTLVTRRGAIMAEHAIPGGGMARISAPAAELAEDALAAGLAIACENAPQETVVAGPAERLAEFVETLQARGIEGSLLNVSSAFHTQAQAPAQYPFARELAQLPRMPIAGKAISTVTGQPIESADEVESLLVEQLVSPVRLATALARAAEHCDLFVEVGPGSGMARLVAACGLRAISIDAFSDGLQPLLSGLGQLHVEAYPVDTGFLYADRPIRAFAVGSRPSFLASPCATRRTMHRRSAGDDARQIEPCRKAPRDFEPALHPRNPGIAAGGAEPHLAGDAERVKHRAREIIAAQIGLPIGSVEAHHRLLADLHINSLSVGRIVAQLAREMEIEPIGIQTDFSEASVAELAEQLCEIARHAPQRPDAATRIEGVDHWIASFEPAWAQTEQESGKPSFEGGTDPSAAVNWQLAGDLTRLTGFRAPPPARPSAESGTILLLDRDLREEPLISLWRGVKQARLRGHRHIAIVHRGVALEGFVRSLHADGVFDDIRLIDVAELQEVSQSVDDLLSLPSTGVLIRRVDACGRLLSPVLRKRGEGPAAKAGRIGPGDVVLVTGGARGIGAECALRLGERTGARLLLVGRSPVTEPAVRHTLNRASELGIAADYRQLDISSSHCATPALAEAERELGRITAVVHAAGINQPAHFDAIEEDELRATLSPKLLGLEALLTALDWGSLRLFVTFGSIIGHLGLAGETHYALANAVQTQRLREWQAQLSTDAVRTLALDWSIWAGAGMGERLGTIERLTRQGIEAIPLARALDEFERVVLSSDAGGNRIITSRFGQLPGIAVEGPPLPDLRFLDSVRIHTPAIEIVADAKLSIGSDPYLQDHLLDGECLMPGAMLLEAMAQAAVALIADRPIRRMVDVRFERAVSLAPVASLVLRVAALRVEEDVVQAVVRAGDDGFASIRARAEFRFTGQSLETEPANEGGSSPDMFVPAAGLYGSLFFGRGRFAVLESYKRLSAFAVEARFRQAEPTAWFGPYLPPGLVLGSPATRDGGFHALQAAVPQCRVIPVAVEAIELGGHPAAPSTVRAREEVSTPDSFTFSVDLLDGSGIIVERWRGARFSSIGELPVTGCPAVLRPVWLERAIARASGLTGVRIALVEGADRAVRRQRALETLGLGDLHHLGDGKPLSAAGCAVSLSHNGTRTMLAAGPGVIACDLVGPEDEPETSDADRALVGANPGSGLEKALWAARECLRKGGLPAGSPFAIAGRTCQRVSQLACGAYMFVFLQDGDIGTAGVLVKVDGHAKGHRTLKFDGTRSACAGSPCPTGSP